jgi:hypothetical protein
MTVRIKDEKIKLNYSIASVLKQQRRLIEDVPLKKYTGHPLDEASITAMAEYLRWKLRRSDIPLSFYTSALDPFRYRTITPEAMIPLLKRIASVAVVYEQGRSQAAAWIQQQADEWIPVFVDSVEKQPEEEIWNLKCIPLCGQMVGVAFDYAVSLRMALRIARRCGFSQRSEFKRLVDPMQLSGLRLLLKILKGSTQSRVRVGDCGECSSITAFNRKMIDFRDPSKWACRFQMNVPCFRCTIGTDQCPIAVIKETKSTA